jgi:hypothetical protein
MVGAEPKRDPEKHSLGRDAWVDAGLSERSRSIRNLERDC